MRFRRQQSNLFPIFAFNAVTFVLYVLSGKWGLSLAFLNSNATAVWPPSGIALTALLLGGIEVTPSIFLGALAVNLLVPGSAGVAPFIAVGNTAEALIAYALIKKYAHGSRVFYQSPDIFKYFSIVSFASFVSAIIGVSSITLAGTAHVFQFKLFFLTWWLGDLASMIVLTPFLVMWSHVSIPPWNIKRIVEGTLVAAGSLVVGQLIFGGWTPSSINNDPLAFLYIPPLLWAAFRFGPRGSALATLLLLALAIHGTYFGFGPFSSADRNKSFILLQSFVSVTTIMSLVIASGTQERRLNEKELQDQKDRLYLALETSRMGMWDHEIGSGYLYLSRGAEALFGLNPNEFGGTFQAFLNLIHPEDRAHVEHVIEQAVMRGVDHEVDFRVIWPNGSTHWIVKRGHVVKDKNGMAQRVIGMGADITQRKNVEHKLTEQAAALWESNKELEQFAYASSHDLKEPLRTVSIYSEMLHSKYAGKLDQEGDRFLRAIMNGVDRMRTLVDGLLVYSGLKKHKFEYENLNLNQIVAQVLQDLEPLIQEKLAVVTHDTLPTIQANRLQMNQLLQNLLVNALKYNGNKPPRIHIASQEKDGCVVLSVKDNGIGIAKEFSDRIFQVFQRLHSQSQVPGAGLGLAICKRIVEKHHGKIWVESEVDKGATFFIRLPQTQSASIEMATASA